MVGEDGKLHTVSTEAMGDDGKLHTVNVGSVIVHRSSPEDVYVNEQGQQVDASDPHAHVVTKHSYSYDFQAAALSDWEGKADQDQHRHGGENVATAPKETSVTGVSSMGPVLGKEDVKTTTTMDVGDKRIISDAPQTQTANTSANTNNTVTLNAGDARIVSMTPAPVVFVPAGEQGYQEEDEDGWIHVPGSPMFGKGGLSAALTAVALGAVQTTAFAKPDADDQGFVFQAAAPGQVVGAGSPLGLGDDGHASASSNPDASATSILLSNFTVVHPLHLGVLNHSNAAAPSNAPAGSTNALGGLGTPGAPAVQPLSYHYTTNVAAALPDGFISTTPGVIYVGPAAPASTVPTSPAPSTTTPAPDADAPQSPVNALPANPGLSPTLPVIAPTPINTTPTPPTANSATTADDHLSDPLEDTVLQVSIATLLANDSHAVGIEVVGNPAHGTVRREIAIAPYLIAPHAYITMVTGLFHLSGSVNLGEY